jgi:osmoprotectant transport system permease protein
LGKPSAILALVLYAQFILLRSMVSGLKSVDFSAVEAARGLGLSAIQIFCRVEAPMAMPIWINGLRNATLTTLSIATTAAWINAGGLGTLIFDGLSQNNSTKILTGALLISGLSLLLDYGLKAAEIEATQIANGELA